MFGVFVKIPEKNVGWYLVTWTIYQVFSLFTAYRKTALIPMINRNYDYLAVVYYISIAINNMLPSELNSKETVTDLSGKAWLVANLYETTLIVTIFTMGFVSVLALIRLRNLNVLEHTLS